MLQAPVYGDSRETDFNEVARSLLVSLREKNRLLADYLCPVDQRIQDFIDRVAAQDSGPESPRVPNGTFTLDRLGLARALSLPPDRDHFESDIVNSYRLAQGVLHNPKHDRRTTKGAFHVVEHGPPVPYDKKGVPRSVFARLFHHAFNPPNELLQLPFTSSQDKHAELFVSLYLRPIVCPEVAGICPELSMETRFFAPGTLVSNLDFVETIFSNAGDPSLSENDAGLDIEHWTGHTGCVVLAPHLINLGKKELGLPNWDDATERQRRDGMAWKSEDELYNDGDAFKVTCRDLSGVIVTIIADNYFGYSKKEVKTQIGYAANLYGMCEEEHSGGAIAFPSYDLDDAFAVKSHIPLVDHTFLEVKKLFADIMDLQPEGYGIDRKNPHILYIPEDARIDLYSQSVTWSVEGKEATIRLLPENTYVLPSGYKVKLTKGTSGTRWRLIGTRAQGVFCHKPCTVSGGGKSEISKSISDAFIHCPVFTADIEKDFLLVDEILKRDYDDTRFVEGSGYKASGRPILGPERTLGSVIKLLTPASYFTPEYNEWLESIPRYIKELVFVIKQYYRLDWGESWKGKFSVDIINGKSGNQLKYKERALVANYVRVGISQTGLRRIFGLRRDFSPAAKLQMADDITASVVVPTSKLSNLDPDYEQPSVKFIKNCERRLFQRPDDAIHRGYDKQTELDLTQPDNFLCNFEPLTSVDARNLTEDSIGFDEYTEPMKALIKRASESNRPRYFVSSAHPRLVKGVPTKNPRYLQVRPDLVDDTPWYLAEIGIRFYRRIPLSQPVHMPVNAVLPGRRNNPPDLVAGIRSLAVFNPIHYMELPELFMEFICSMTGKSPSTTGAGSEGGLTKGPFNALPAIIDLNNALVSYMITGYECFLTAAGHVGPGYRVDHDISLLIPELWCRMEVNERDPRFLIDNGYLEPCEDFEHNGSTVYASRLGYRITSEFVNDFFGRVFNNPSVVIREPMLRPETQDVEVFVDGIDNIVTTHKRVAQMYIDDGTIEMACPPLRALLYIMANGEFDGKDVNYPGIRKMFTREGLLKSDWYTARLKSKQEIDVRLWKRHTDYLSNFLSKSSHRDEAERLEIRDRAKDAEEKLSWMKSSKYLDSLKYTIGADPQMVIE